MQTHHAPAADWRNADEYAPLLACDRTAFAWEWLRRDPAYRQAARAGRQRPEATRLSHEDAGAAVFGLHMFEAPDRPASAARPVWRAADHAPVLLADAAAGGVAADRFNLDALPRLWSVVRGRSGEHVLLSDGCRSIRLDICKGSVLGGPVLLRYRLSGLCAAEKPLLVLRRLLCLCRNGAFCSGLHPREAKASRMVTVLRTHDALTAGADQREMAALLLSHEAASARWRVRTPSLRSQVQRLVRTARGMSQGAWRDLLA